MNGETIQKFLSGMFSFSWDIVGVLMAITVMYGIFKIHRSDSYDKVDYLDLILDLETGRMSDSKFRLNIAFALTSFVLIYLTLNNKLTEWYVTAFLGAWVIDRWGSRNASSAIIRNQRDVFKEKLRDEGLFDPTLEAQLRERPYPYSRSRTEYGRNQNDNSQHGRPKHQHPNQPGGPGTDEG